MRGFIFDGLCVQVDEEAGLLRFRERWFVIPLACAALGGLSFPFLVLPFTILVAAILGQVKGGEGLVGLERVAWYGFVALLSGVFALMFLVGLRVLWPLLGLIRFGFRWHELDRRHGRFRVGRRDVCAIERISAVVLALGRDPESELERYYLRLRLEDGRDLRLTHLGHHALTDQDAGHFVAELAGFLGVPIVKAHPRGSGDPFDDEFRALLDKVLRTLHLRQATGKPAATHCEGHDPDLW